MKATCNYTGLRVTKYPLKKRRDATYDEAYNHIGIKATAARGAGMLARAKNGAVYHCEACEIEGMTLDELRAHWRETHKERK